MPSDTPGDATPRDPGPAGEPSGVAPAGDPGGGDRAGVAPEGDVATGSTAVGSSGTGEHTGSGETTAGPAIAKPDWREAPRTAASDDKPKATGRRAAARFLRGKDHRDRVRVRRVLRVVRHIDPWSVLRVSGLFFAALFVIICVASAALWTVARGSGVVDDVESFVTSVGGFGNCENLDPSHPSATTTTAPGATTTTVAGADPATPTTVGPVEPVDPVNPVDDEDCPAGQELVGEFRFEDGRILQAYVLGGVVLVVAGAAGMVVLTLLFNVFSDITGGVRVTVLEEDRKDVPAGSPPKRDRG